MTVQINAPAEGSFATPLQLLSDCHRRIERFLDQLVAVTEEARGGSLSSSQRESLDSALRYFAGAAPLHSADEEVSLFPRLRAECGPGAESELLSGLESDHREADIEHAAIEAMGRRWLVAGELSAQDAADLLGRLTGLREFYRKHIALEDEQIFPLAARILGAEPIEAIGREMATRRGLDFDNIPAELRCYGRRLARRAG